MTEQEHTFTEAELRAKAVEFARQRFSTKNKDPFSLGDSCLVLKPDYHEKLGVLIDFIWFAIAIDSPERDTPEQSV